MHQARRPSLLLRNLPKETLRAEVHLSLPVQQARRNTVNEIHILCLIVAGFAFQIQKKIVACVGESFQTNQRTLTTMVILFRQNTHQNGVVASFISLVRRLWHGRRSEFALDLWTLYK